MRPTTRLVTIGRLTVLLRPTVRPGRARWPGILPLLGALLLAAAAGCSGGAQAPPAREAVEAVSFDELMRGVVGGRAAFRDDVREVEGFGGVYHEGCDLIVLVTESGAVAADQVAARYRPMLQSMGSDGPCQGRVRLREARFSWEQLARWYHDDLRLAGLGGITTHGINVVRNRIVIGVAGEDAVPGVLQRLEEVRVPREAVLIGITGPAPEPRLAYTLLVRAVVAEPPHSVAGARVLVLRGADTVVIARTAAPAGVEVEVPAPGRYRVVLDSAAGYRRHPRQPETIEVDVFRRYPVAEATFYLLPAR